ncbi:small proline-rich protein 2D-like [Apis dorsata]|uniref:small proline-rich protein 2D-like n=1 Tax=Apis dorsata TaxID=7462 RepID=UPI0003DF7E1E|nr:small proline-rich protein 2D-like [Apis dorsata]
MSSYENTNRKSTLPPRCYHCKPSPFYCPKYGCPPPQQYPPSKCCCPSPCPPFICRPRPEPPPKPPTLYIVNCLPPPDPPIPKCTPPKLVPPPSCVRYCITDICGKSCYCPRYFTDPQCMKCC